MSRKRTRTNTSFADRFSTAVTGVQGKASEINIEAINVVGQTTSKKQFVFWVILLCFLFGLTIFDITQLIQEYVNNPYDAETRQNTQLKRCK